MEENSLKHQKKVKLMGTIILVLSILSAVGMLFLLLVSGVAYSTIGDELDIKGVFNEAAEFAEDVSAIDVADTAEVLSESESILKDLNDEGLAAEKRELEVASRELKEAQKELDEALTELKEEMEGLPTTPLDLKSIFYGCLVASILTLIISVFLFMIGRSWRRLEPFSKGVIFGVRGLGITFLAQSLLSFFWPLPDEDGDAMVQMLNSTFYLNLSFAPLFSLGLLLLTLSWVIEHGQKLEEVDKLTV